MTRILQQKIDVETDGKRPRAFLFRDQQYFIVEILDFWIEADAWWKSFEDHGDREMFRVLTDQEGIFELEHDLGDDVWQLYKVWD